MTMCKSLVIVLQNNDFHLIKIYEVLTNPYLTSKMLETTIHHRDHVEKYTKHEFTYCYSSKRCCSAAVL